MSKPTALNALAKTLKSLHVSGNPVIFANVHDAAVAAKVASSPSSKAVATASYSIAASQCLPDAKLTLPANLVGIRNVVQGIKNAGQWGIKPFTADLQDGYDDIADTIKQAIAEGVVGANIEDLETDSTTGSEQLRSIEDAEERIRVALKAAGEAGVPDFVINARTDVLGYGGSIDDCIERGKRYLAAGATTVFVWGCGKHDITISEVKQMVNGLDGKLAVHGPGPTKLSIKELAEAGVSRISVGPWFAVRSWQIFGDEAGALLSALEN